MLSTALNFVLTGLLGSLSTWVAMRMRAMSKRQDEAERRQREELAAIKAGMVCSLRADLVDMHRRYVVDGVPCPVSEKDRMDETYHAYHALGGNGTGTVLWQQVMEEAKVGGSKEWRSLHGGTGQLPNQPAFADNEASNIY